MKLKVFTIEGKGVLLLWGSTCLASGQCHCRVTLQDAIVTGIRLPQITEEQTMESNIEHSNDLFPWLLPRASNFDTFLVSR